MSAAVKPVDTETIRSFLLTQPRPSRVLVTKGDGDTQEIAPPQLGKGGSSWALVARTIASLDPAMVEVFDDSGKLLRAQRFDAEAREDGSLPDILARDAESARIALFAQLIANAYKFSVDTAFTKMVELTERLDNRLERMEVRLERAESSYRRVMQERIDEAFDEAGAIAREAEAQKADPAAAIMQTFMGGVAQGASAQGASAPPNGAKK